MLKVRQGVFETNSSSTHSITVTTEETYNAWLQGLVKFNEWSETFTERKVMTDADKRACREDYQASKPSYYKDWDDLSDKDKQMQYDSYARKYLDNMDSDFITNDEWRCRHSGCEFSEVHYTTEHGDKIVAFGCGGYDG